VAALWPWRNRNNRYDVAVTNMNKDVTCGGGSPENHCFHDWIIWHRNFGVQHFFIYDNLSTKDHPWLKAAQTYIDQGILTLIDWPIVVGGQGNNLGQRVAMNHAMFALASRVKWLGYFDVDEFFTPSSLMLTGNNNKGNVYKEQVVQLLDSTAATITSDTSSYIGIRTIMRRAQHPDYCDVGDDVEDMKKTTRLSRCVAFRDPALELDNHSKTFLRLGEGGPRYIYTPHMVDAIYSKGQTVSNTFNFLHFSTKYGCRHSDDESCSRVDTLALSQEVRQLEHQLDLFDKGEIGVCKGSEERAHCI